MRPVDSPMSTKYILFYKMSSKHLIRTSKVLLLHHLVTLCDVTRKRYILYAILYIQTVILHEIISWFDFGLIECLSTVYLPLIQAVLYLSFFLCALPQTQIAGNSVNPQSCTTALPLHILVLHRVSSYRTLNVFNEVASLLTVAYKALILQ